MKAKLFQILLLVLLGGFAQANLNDSTLTKTRVDVSLKYFDIFDAHNFGQSEMKSLIGNFNSWSFNVFYEKLPLGPIVTNLKGDVGLYEMIEGVEYYRSGILNKMLIEVAGRTSIGFVYLGMINEHTFFEIEELGPPAAKRVDRYGAFFGFDILYERERAFLNKFFLSAEGEYFKVESPYAPEVSINFDMKVNFYKMRIYRNFSISPVIGFGMRDNGISLDQYPLANLGLAFNYDRAHYNLLTINYQQRVISSTDKKIHGIFLELNIDPYIFFPKFFWQKERFDQN